MAKILIIDDDPDIVEAMKVVLESKDYKVGIAESGNAGLKKDKNYQDIPILMLTAIKEKTGLDFKQEAGDEIWLPVDDYVDKPLKPAQLLSKVESLLENK